MSRVQHRGEPDPLYAAAGQRLVLNCQSPESDGVSAELMFMYAHTVMWKRTRHKIGVVVNDMYVFVYF